MAPGTAPLPDDATYIEFAYCAATLALLDSTKQPMDQEVAGLVPAELEKEYLRLASMLGLEPVAQMNNLDAMKMALMRQFKKEREKALFEMGMLLVEQHTLMTAVQTHPGFPLRPQLCYLIQETQSKLKKLFNRFGLDESLRKLAPIPLPNAPDSWKTWSGDVLKYTVLNALRGRTGS